MCAIVGMLCSNNSNAFVQQDMLQKMRDAMAHRGPDGAGLWLSDNKRVGIGHRRLAILDLSEAAGQPFQSEDASVSLVFNGEIYNHHELRDELKAIAPQLVWKTRNSDTEVILRGYQVWGIGVVERLRGMFAIAIWDQTKSQLYLVRDRFGIKPLYYAENEGVFSFASEIKALLKNPNQTVKVNNEAIFHYLSFLTCPAPQTFYKDIYKVPASHYVRISSDGVKSIHRYYHVLTAVSEGGSKMPSNAGSLNEYVIESLQQSVTLHQESDVPVGVFLSGGIDSSLNVALFSRDRQKQLKTFTIGYDESSKTYGDERGFAKVIAQQFGTDHFEKVLTEKDLIEFIPRMIVLQDEPIGDPVCFPVYQVSKLAIQNGVKVCQVGEGSDELFLGYPLWQNRLVLHYLNRIFGFNWLKKIVSWLLCQMNKKESWAFELLQRSLKNQNIFWGGAEAFTEVEKKNLLSDTFLSQLAVSSSYQVLEPIFDDFKKHDQENSQLNWMTYIDLTLRLPELLLMRVDKMGMGVSLEARVPFLDHKFVESMLRIPTRVRQGGIFPKLKVVLKSAVRGILPNQIIDRPKQGFGVPLHDWLFTELGPEMRRTILDFNQRSMIFKPVALERLLESRRGPQIWYVYNLACWYNLNFPASKP